MSRGGTVSWRSCVEEESLRGGAVLEVEPSKGGAVESWSCLEEPSRGGAI